MPDAPEILRLVREGEGRQVEFKEGLAEDGRIARTVCAFANTRGGVVLFGIDDRGAIRGAPRPESLTARLRTIAADGVEPPVAVRVGTTRVGPKPVVWCSVPLSPSRPHAVRPPPGAAAEVVIRVGSSNRAASPAALASLRPETVEALADLDRAILAAAGRSGGTDLGALARSLGAGRQRTRQAVERLERAGLLIAHGLGDRRVWEIP